MSSFPVDASLSRYAASLPITIPRVHGMGRISSGAPGPFSAEVTLVRLVTKEAAVGAAGGGLKAADAEREAVQCAYSAGDGGLEQRTLTSAFGKGKVTLESVRKAAAAAVAKAKALKLGALEFELPVVEGADAGAVADALVQAAALANYSFNRYFTGSKAPHILPSFHVAHSLGADVDEAVRVAAVLTDAVIVARDLGNERSDEMHPARVEAVARAVAAETGMEFFSIVGEELLEKQMHMHYSVGQAAKHAPRYLELRHNGDPAQKEDVIAIVGKGITFDSGGLNIKPTGSMEDMHIDKQGASNVLGIALAVGRLRIARNIVFVLAVAENAVDSDSYKPHNIMRSMKGLTVTNGNTDAEGRLVLGDSLYCLQTRHRPHTIIDMATLTGACVVALGEYAAGAFSNSKALREAVIAAGAARGEVLWPMPILPEHRAELASCAFADLKSTGNGRYGGACTAAAFLENFIGLADEAADDYKPAWLHCDIAGPAMVKGSGTGFGVLSVLHYLLRAPAGALRADE